MKGSLGGGRAILFDMLLHEICDGFDCDSEFKLGDVKITKAKSQNAIQLPRLINDGSAAIFMIGPDIQLLDSITVKSSIVI
jgi:hypothetical protein